MTLIGVSVSADRAQIVTDSWSYSPGFRHLGEISKVKTLPHLHLAMAASGDTRACSMLTEIVRICGERHPTFDEVLDVLPSRLLREEETLQRALSLSDDALSDLVLFVVGPSARRGRFVAYSFSYLDSFQAREIQAAEVLPAPKSTPLGGHEYRLWSQLNTSAAANDGVTAAELGLDSNAEAVRRMLTTWRDRPWSFIPRTEAQWKALAVQVKADRSRAPLSDFRKVLVGGQLWLTEVTIGSIHTRLIHIFDDTSANLGPELRGTLHPLGQAGPCPCDSGSAYRNCCLLPLYDRLCLCGSGKTLADCCLVTDRPRLTLSPAAGRA